MSFDQWMERACTRSADWRPWFAWFPVTASGKRVWLRMVERRIPSHYDEFLRGWRADKYPAEWEYRRP